MFTSFILVKHIYSEVDNNVYFVNLNYLQMLNVNDCSKNTSNRSFFGARHEISKFFLHQTLLGIPIICLKQLFK